MKRTAILLLSGMICLAAMSGCSAAEKEKNTTTCNFEQIVSGVYFSAGSDGEGNQGLAVGSDAFLIIDAPDDEARIKANARELAERFPKHRPILVLTSSRREIRGGYRELKKALPTLEVWTTKATLAEAAKEGITGGLAIEKEEVFDLGGIKAELLPFSPAATAGDLAVYIPQEKVLFAGELVLDKRLPRLLDGDSAQWINRLQELATRPISIILPAVGSRTDFEAIDWTRQYLVLLRSQVCLLRSQGYADDDIFYFCNVPGYEKYTHGSDLFKKNVEYVVREVREKGDVCTLPSKPLPKLGPVTWEDLDK